MKRDTRRTLSLAATPDGARRLTQHPFDAEFQAPGSNVSDAEMISALPSATPGRKRMKRFSRSVIQLDFPLHASRDPNRPVTTGRFLAEAPVQM
jgi:hypothetical protein